MLSSLLLPAMRAQLIAKPNLALRPVFVDNLAFVYQLIIASEGLLRMALEELPPPGGDEFLDDLGLYYEKHLAEETGHAAMLENDLRAAGVGFRQLSWHAIETVGAQYYLIQHVHPVTLLGYIAFLECFPASMQLVEKLELLHGVELCRTLRYHAEHDIEHGNDVIGLLDLVPDEWRALVFDNGVRTAQRMCAAAMTFGQGE